MKKLYIYCLILLFFVSCKFESDSKSLSIATYNLYLCFDGYEEGSEYSPFTLKDGYTSSVYKKRVESLSKFLIKYFGDIDIILLQEVENAAVLKDILESGLKRKGFFYYGVISNSSPFGVGYLSKYPPSSSAIHQVSGSRPFLELQFNINGEDIILYTLHAQSRIEEENVNIRYEIFSLLATSLALNEDKLRLVLGDFNVDLSEPEIGFAPDSSPLSLTAPLVATSDRYFKEGIYFSPLLDKDNSIGSGTYFYLGKWSFLDNVLISKEGFNNIGWEYSSISLIAPYEAKDSSGFPKKFDVKSGEGYSDHFALKVKLNYL